MSSVTVAPFTSGDDNDTVTLQASVRILLLDAVTGQPVRHAYADRVDLLVGGELEERPYEAFRDVLEQRGSHPFRVLGRSNVSFCETGKRDKTWQVPIVYLPKCRRSGEAPGPDGSNESRAFEPETCLDESSGEFFDALPGVGPEVLADGGRVFYPLDQRAADHEPRWVLVRENGQTLARRDLISDRDGILTLPVGMNDVKAGATFSIHFRDYVCLQATDTFDAGASPAGIGERLRLQGSRTWSSEECRWFVDVGDGENDSVFRDTATVRTPDVERVPFRKLVSYMPFHFTFWVVRRVRKLPENARPNPSSERRRVTRERSGQGIVIHYNSGYLCEMRPDASAKWDQCREALRQGKNDFVWHPELPHRLLRRLQSAAFGYHYLIDRSGTIWRAADEQMNVGHAGESQEPESVSARCGPVDSDSETRVFTFKHRQELFNTRYTGVCLIGNHSEERHFFNETQVWYLHRLIDDIRNRHSGRIHWYRVLGHDEVTQHRIPRDRKPDPGAALQGGMVALRARCGACDPAVRVRLEIISAFKASDGGTLPVDKARITVENQVEGQGSCDFERPPGEYFVKITATGHLERSFFLKLPPPLPETAERESFLTWVDRKPDAMAFDGEVILKPERGRLTIRICPEEANKKARVKLGGDLATKGLRAWNIRPMALTIHVSADGYSDKEVAVTIEAGKEHVEEITLVPK